MTFFVVIQLLPMIPRFTWSLLAAAVLAGPAALAQTTTYDLSATHRYVQTTQLWPQVQGEWNPGEHDYLLLAVQGRRILDDSYGSNRHLGFDARQLLVGYEHFADNARWSYGGTARLYGDGFTRGFIPEALLRHRSDFGGLVFGQRLSVERTFGSTQALESGPAAQFWGRLRVDVERKFYLGGSDKTRLVLRPRLSYEAATHLRLQKADNEPDERTIQYTSLRGEVGLRVSAALDFTPWFAYQTRYLATLPQYDQNGNPTAGGKINYVFPTVGLDLRFRLRPTAVVYEKTSVLPTQH